MKVQMYAQCCLVAASFLPFSHAQSLFSGISPTRFEDILENGSCVLRLPSGLKLGGRELDIIFQSAESAASSSHFGSGWRLPIIDATCYKLNEDVYVAESLHGRKITLRKDKDGRFRTSGTNWEGVVNGDRFEMKSAENERISFSKGYIESFSDDLNSYTIIRERGKTSVLRNGGGLFSVESGETAPASVKILDSGNAIISIVEKELLANGSAVINKIESSSGKIAIRWIVDGVRTQGMQLDDKIVTWGSDGRVLQNGKWRYSFGQLSDGKVQMKRRSSDEDEIYFMDSGSGLASWTNSDGEIVEHLTFVSGPSRGQIRRFRLYGRDGNLKKDIKYYYDSKGQILRIVNGQSEGIFVKDLIN